MQLDIKVGPKALKVNTDPGAVVQYNSLKSLLDPLPTQNGQIM